ncbi:hypothetical protein CF593_15540 [Enterococcus faecium]|nr:hypothetical protein CF593_15540 [Enterococcus faecium]
MREPVYFKKWVIFWREILLARARLFYLFFKDFLEPFLGAVEPYSPNGYRRVLTTFYLSTNNFLSEY